MLKQLGENTSLSGITALVSTSPVSTYKGISMLVVISSSVETRFN